MTRFSSSDKAIEARREVRQRQRVYSRLVGEGKMNGKSADRQIAIMEEIAADYAERAEADEQEERLL